MSTANTKCTLNLEKNLKTYKRSSQGPITQYFAASSGSNGNPPGTLSDDTQGTLILQESPSSPSSDRSDVFKVTAKPMTDISKNVSDRYLLYDHLLISKEEFSQTVPNNTGKRPNNKSSINYPAKRAKPDKEDTKSPEKTDSNGQQPSSTTEFSFVVSEDEDEKKPNLVHGDTEIPTVYFCKHCDYSDVAVTHVSTHYQNHHPYIRYNAVYIQDPSDQSATFRCLECPVEFLHVADLKIHYEENHPGAPDVFVKQSHELCLVFKCFVCPFITDVLEALKNHYKEIHPTHKVDSSLLYCRYSANRCKEGSSLLNICEKAPSPESSEGISPERAHTPCKDVSPQCPTSKGAAPLYQCSNCRFSHKSPVVMHVHYQKSHPDEVITIDKIKKSDHVKLSRSQMMPELTQEPLTKIENYTLQANTSKEDTPELSAQKTPEPLKHTEDSKIYSESVIIKKAESAEDRSKTKKSPTRGTSIGMDNLSPISPNTIFYCQFCRYSNTNIKSVVSHHNAKHSLYGAAGIQEIVHYSAKVQKRQGEAETSESASSGFKTRNEVEVCRKNELQHEKNEAHASEAGFNAYEFAENLFYCQKCNFGNPTIKGVLNHQFQTHHRINSSRGSIIEHTALIRAEIEKSKSHTKAFSFATHLPLPLLNEDDENMFFCHFCNYRQSTVSAVMKHYFKRHRGYEVKSKQIQLYTSVVLEQTQKLHQSTAKQQEVNCATLGNKGNKTKVKNCDKSFSFSASPSLRAPTLHCSRCSFATRFVCLLRRHMWKAHKANCSVNKVLRGCFNQGSLQTGYHCDWCVFSHTNATVLYEHYKEQHPGRTISLKYISAQLYVGPDTSTMKKPQINHTYDTDSNGSEANLSSQRLGQNESKIYSCRACLFKGSSMSDITCHYRAVHPWSVKEDGSVLDVNSKMSSANSQWEDQNEIPASFHSYQVPLEYDTLPNSSHEETSPTLLKCPYCPANFHTQHGLSTHCGMKHPQAVTEYVDAQKEHQIQIQKHLHVFKCPYCAYVNTNNQGIRTHCQMKHPAFVSRAESLHVDGKHLHSLDDCVKQKGSDDSLRVSGYICKTCSQICATLEKLNMHCEKNHKTDQKQDVPKTLKPAPKPSAIRKIQQYKCHSTQGSVSKASFLRKKIYAVIRCQQCSYRCSTKIALSRHLRIHYRNASVSNVSECIYKCALCSMTFFRKNHLGSHYTKKHGQDAFLKYYAPVYKQIPQTSRPTSSDCHSTQQQENSSEPCQSSKMTEKNRILVYKCPSCPYVNVSYHGTLTHCQMKHPALVARADELQTDEIVEFPVGKDSNKRGYMCKKCQQIYSSVIKLKLHCERGCSDEIEIKKRPDYGSRGSMLGTASLKNKTSGASTTETDLNQLLGTTETCQSNALSAQNKKALYECCMCSYTGLCRKYLYCHYKNAHKMDGLSTCKLLEKYYRRKRNKTRNLPSTESEETTDVKCKKCPNLIFNSLRLLVAHYGTSHQSECKLDFTVVSEASKRNTGVYKCAHCKKQINGIKKLYCHLERHRVRWNRRAKVAEKKASFVTPPETKPIKLCRQDELPMLNNVAELAQWNVTPAETFTLPPSPGLLPSKFSDIEQPDLQSRKGEHICEQCGRTFKSLKGLRSHERSHAAVAAIKKLDNLPTSALKYNINKYVLYKPGITRPFLCRYCCYRTTVMGLWRSHFMKKHREAIMDSAEIDNQDESVRQINKEPPVLTEEMNTLPEPDEKHEMSGKSLYLEPPDVQRQLNQFSLMTQMSFSSKANLQETVLPESSLLYCESCSFSSGHLSSLRRHYLNRHGKKMLRCKDCDFITGTRKTLEMHMESGHSTRQLEPTHEKGIRCPFCLYQTTDKNNMIDHIILHREKRVVPIEVRRPKLSRYLQGIIFRCHKCTFTSGSAENLHVHMMRHNDIKPYKCRLCYFDCSQLSDLEAHLIDKHQVLRNHELVGQISLDELQASGRMPEEELLSNSEHNSDCGDLETEEFVTDCNEVLQMALANNMVENTVGDKVTLQMKTYQKYDQGPQGGLEKQRQEESHAQHKLRHGVDSSMQFMSQKEQVAEGSSTCKIPEKAQAHKLQMKTLQQRMLKIEASGKDDILCHIPVLGEDGGICKIQQKIDQDGTLKVKNIETEVVNNIPSDSQLLDEKSSIILVHSPTNHAEMKLVSPFKGKNHMRANYVRVQKSCKVEKQLLNFTPNCAQLKIPRESLGVPFTKCKEEQMHNQKNTEEVTEPYGEMPVFKNEYLEDKESEMITEHVENQRKDKKQERDGTKEADKPYVHRGTFIAADVAAEALCPSVEHKKYSCEFCGRNLMNSYELERHILRHGM